MQDSKSNTRMLRGAALGVVIGGVIGAILGAIEGVILPGLGVGPGLLAGIVGGAVPGGCVGALLPVMISRELMRAVPGLNEEELVNASSKLRRLNVAAGDVIVRQGDEADKFYVVSKGEVEVVRDEQGAQRDVAVLGPGQFFGEIGLLRATPRSATVRAKTAAQVLALDGATFSQFIAASAGGRPELERTADRRIEESRS